MLTTKHQILSILLLFYSVFLFAQEFSISGKVVDQNNEPLSFVNVVLRMSSDNSIVSGTSTNDSGKFNMNNLYDADYTIEFSFIGYKTVSFPVKLNGNIDLKQIILNEDAESLGEVTLIAKKPTIKRAADRLTFNIENTALSEGDILQALRNTPGVLILDGNLSVKGSAPTVYVNNRKVNLSSEELSQLLESSSANSVKSIEVITNPSARYDADSGTVINIIMSKNLVVGYRGSVFSNYTQGVFPRYQLGTSQSFKNKDVSLTANYTYTKAKINRDSENDINYFDTSTNDVSELWRSNLNRNWWSETHTLNLNFDWYASEKSTLSLSGNALYLPYFKYVLRNNTTITDLNQIFLGRFTSDNLSRDDKYNIGLDLDFNHQFNDKLSLLLNGHYTTYDYQRRQDVFSEFFDNTNLFDRATAFNTLANQGTEIFSSKADLTWTLSDNASLDSGVKFSKVETNSDISQFDIDVNTGNSTLDLGNTDAFNYDEKVFAAYTNYGLETEKWSVSLGIRAEQTNIDANSLSTNVSNTQDYLEWFPNASITHSFSDSFSLYANYKRSLTRPNYTALNPFNFFLNDNTVVTGNPSLVPTFLDHYVIGTTFLDLFTIEAYYQNYDGNIVELPRQNNATNILEYTYVNIDKTVDFGFDLAVDFYPTDNWNIYAVTSFYNLSEESEINGVFNTIERWSNYSILSSNLSLLEDNSLNINLDLTWVGKNVQAFQTVEDRLFSSLVISKTILNKKGVISLAVEDIFNFQDGVYSTRYRNQFSKQNDDLDNRYVRLGFRYKFGNTSLKTNQKTINKEERDRLNQSGNNN